MDELPLPGVAELSSRLRPIPLFRELEEDDLRQLAAEMKPRPFRPGELVVRQGDPGEELFVILEGHFQVILSQEVLDFEKELRRLGPGDYFGEIALLAGSRRLASVRALTPGVALALHEQPLRQLLSRSPTTALALCRGLTEYLEQGQQAGQNVPFISLEAYPTLKEVHKLLPPRVALLCRAVAVEKREGVVKVALVNPYDSPTRTFLRDALRPHQVEFVAIGDKDFERYRHLHLGEVRTQLEEREEADAEKLTYLDDQGNHQPLGDSETGLVLQQTFRQALRFGASDIHFEPGSEGGRARLRIDGKMMPSPEPIPSRLFAQVVSRLKVMSNLNITDRNLPQDGRFPLRIGEGQRVEVRTSVLPCQGGEKVVLRLLGPWQRMTDLDSVILSRPVALLVREMFLAPAGLLLVCGPTGSGKTTTLYAGLTALWNESQAINVVTAEDPVEYQLDFATQVAVNRAVGLDFPQILRSLLRQDPDVILVGEIRDQESAVIATEAATTGHMVLSSLHTDSALDAIGRLRHLQVKQYLLGAALRGVISQRLLPRVCRACAEDVPANDEHLNHLRRVGVLPPDWSGRSQRGRGCEICRDNGEVGRVGIFEVLTIDDCLRRLIESSVTWAELSDSLTPKVFIPLARYARFLLEEGIVSPERVKELFPLRSFDQRSLV